MTEDVKDRVIRIITEQAMLEPTSIKSTQSLEGCLDRFAPPWRAPSAP